MPTINFLSKVATLLLLFPATLPKIFSVTRYFTKILDLLFTTLFYNCNKWESFWMPSQGCTSFTRSPKQLANQLESIIFIFQYIDDNYYRFLSYLIILAIGVLHLRLCRQVNSILHILLSRRQSSNIHAEASVITMLQHSRK